MFLGNETREKSGFVSYVSISLCFDFDPTLVCRVIILLELSEVPFFVPVA